MSVADRNSEASRDEACTLAPRTAKHVLDTTFYPDEPRILELRTLAYKFLDSLDDGEEPPMAPGDHRPVSDEKLQQTLDEYAFAKRMVDCFEDKRVALKKEIVKLSKGEALVHGSIRTYPGCKRPVFDFR